MTGQLTLQMLPGAAYLYRGSAPMAIAGRGWSVSAADASATVGTDDTMDFEVRLNARDDCKAVRVDYATADGTATAGTDYTSSSGTLTFQPGESIKTIRVPVSADTVGASDKNFKLRLSNALGVTIADNEAIGTIVDAAATPLPVVSITAASTPVTEGTAAGFTLARTGATDAELTVEVSVSETGAAVGGTVPTQVTFDEGASSATYDVPTEDDDIVEDASTVTATVSSGTGYTVDAEAGSDGVIVNDDDAAPVVSTASPIEAPENGTAVATLTATDADTAVADLSWSILEGADGGADASKFALTPAGVLTFTADKDFEAPDDANADGDYDVTVRVTDGTNPLDIALVVRLTDVDEVPPTLSSATVNRAWMALTFNEALDNGPWPPESPFAVTVAGSSRGVVSVRVYGRAVLLELSSAVVWGEAVTVAYTVPTGQDALPIKDVAGNAAAAFSSTEVTNETEALPVVSTASPIETPENGTAVATLTATDADTAAENLSWSIPEGADGGADASKFALTAAGVLTFTAAKDFEAPDDANADGDYEVTVRVTDGANPVDAALVVRLSDVDEVETLTASFANMPESHDGSTLFQFEVHFSEEPGGLSYRTVRDALFDVSNGRVTKAKRLTRGSNLAFVVTVEPTAQANIDIAVRGTQSCGADHAVCAGQKMLVAGPSVTVLDARTITVTVADAEVDEGPGATLDFVVSLSRTASGDITVSYNTDDGTATAGADYEAVRSSFVFSPGQTEKTVSVVVLDDAHEEDAETVNLAVTATVVNGGERVSVTDNIAIGTIHDVEDAAPTMSKASVDGADLKLTFSEALDGDSVPPASAFAVTVADAARSVDAVAISESALMLALSSAVSSGETVTVRYTVPTGAGAKPLKDAAGNMVADFSNNSVRNETAVIPVVSIAASATPVTEGTAAAFTLARTGATVAELTVEVSVSETGAAMSGTPPTQVTFEAGSESATLSVATDDDEVAEDSSTVTATVSSGTGYTADAESGSAEISVEDDDAAPVVTTASPIVVPENATAVATLTATDADTASGNLSWSIPGDEAGGADAAIFALTAGGELTFRTAMDFEAPDDANTDGDYEITVRVTDGANPVDAALVVRLSDVDEIELSVADAEVEEGPGATLDFVVSLSHAADHDIEVWYVVHDSDGTATAGADYEPVRSNFVFSPGETQRTVSVVVLDDTLNEGAETVNFWISAVRGLPIEQVVDPYATGTILESDQDSEPVTLSVADAEVEEGPGATLDFVVSLSRASDDDVTVYYRAYDGTATAGADYEAVRSSFVLSPGETEKTVSVVVLDDAHDEDAETVNFWITGVRGLTAQQVVDPYATGTIRNTDPMPKAWIARFGRTVGGQVVDALSGRLDGSASSHVTVGGMSLGVGATDAASPPIGTRADWIQEHSSWSSAWGDRQESRSMTGRDVLLGTSFHLSSDEPGDTGAALTAWGRVATGGFEADVDDVRMDGDVTTGMLGFDAQWDRVLAGVMVSQSDGEGSYVLSEEMGDDRGTVESSLTGVYPYARIAMGRRVSAWGLAGIGSGGLTLHQDGQASLETDLSMTMGAVGVKGTVLDPGDENGVGLNVRSDAMWVRTESDRTTGLASAEADVSRLRLVLEGERVFDLGGEATLTPTGQVGVRVDGGDAETGAGLELGAGMRYTAGAITVEGQVRALVAHEESGYEEWGASGTISVSPGSGGRGLTFSIRPEWGRTESASNGLWSARDAGTLVGGEFEAERRLAMDAGYGVGAGGGVLTPYIGMTLGETQSRTMRGGARWELRQDLAVGVEATRSESADADADTDVRLRAALRF